MQTRFAVILVLCFLLLFNLGAPRPAEAGEAADIEQQSRSALDSLLEGSEGARELNKDAAAVLVFPEILKGGLIVAGLYGEGSLLQKEKVAGYYSTVAASIGLQAGVQKFGYAVFFMNPQALSYLKESEGWEVGSSPSLVVVDKGVAGKLSTTSAREDIYVFFFDQKGLMGSLGLRGGKISRYTPDK